MSSRPLRVATRGSALARAQTGHVVAALHEATGVEIDVVIITSEGDRSKESLASLGGTGVFASALREALTAGECDMIVHSLKDLPTAPYRGLTIGAVPEREDPRDALCSRDGLMLDELPEGARVGTGSPRRMAQLLALRPDLEIVDIRGNVDTRLARVRDGDLDAVVLASAGLARLGRLDAASELFALDIWPTAPGQGALAIEIREGDSIPELLSIEHSATRTAVLAERSVLAALEAGCAAPIGATAAVTGDLLELSATVYQPDGAAELGCERSAELLGDDHLVADLLGQAVATQLLEDGAAEIAPLSGRGPEESA
ncbi:hydroxymethylbilane synthase [Herbiconiux sp. CPCC 203407]|uniref:Porphobilinogen deaminase n=1 Tax=Herbiconiux oxytropis TaxID=2970915 RepID=A0AA41XF72_9MICO|nr:hydroxymethylbilane synthase [Herbiconiux oxytropis]MCS5720589.1 hydroxymethylbilane synthase [Herbiconiux oxytropis]MCS5725084.1 hydroxymethylbilane synthase [Herbiconiux oxytropis]